MWITRLKGEARPGRRVDLRRVVCALAVLLASLVVGCGQGDPAVIGSQAGQQVADASAVGDDASAGASLSRPNLLLIVADDLGYSDLGAYGGEIETPTLDALAHGGTRFSQFYAAPMCSPTRAMLLTGVDHHRAGLGNLVERLSDNQRGQPGYEGHLNNSVVTLAEMLQDAGYRTYMTGKWHLGTGPSDPVARGFDRAFALMESGAGHFANMQPLLGPGVAEYSDQGQPVERLPEDFYSSRFYVSRLIEYLEDDRDSERPFFAYLSFTAPHFPLQARRETIDKYRGRYDAGPDAILGRRVERLQASGLLPNDVMPFPQLPSEQAWADLSAAERTREARRMEIYAAMIDDLDREVGALVQYLENRGLREDTVIIFLSDNGAEGHYLRWGLDPLAPWAESCCDNRVENLGNADSYLMLGPVWARVAAAPFRMFKGFTSEGGIRVPAFINFPARVAAGRTSAALATVRDLMPTLLEFAGVAWPEDALEGRAVQALQGRSMLPLLEGSTDRVHAPEAVFGWEMFGKRALRKGRWKILWETEDAQWWNAEALGIERSRWQLYDLETDPAERIDRSMEYPQLLEDMIRSWDRYAEENGVIVPERQRGY